MGFTVLFGTKSYRAGDERREPVLIHGGPGTHRSEAGDGRESQVTGNGRLIVGCLFDDAVDGDSMSHRSAYSRTQRG